MSELKDIVLIDYYAVKESGTRNLLDILAGRISQFARFARLEIIMFARFLGRKCNILIFGFEGFIQAKREVLS